MIDEPKRRTEVQGADRDDESAGLPHPPGVIAGQTELPLPLVPEPVLAAQPRPSGKARGESSPGADDGATVPVPLLQGEALAHDATPPPLPPSPASVAAEVWLEDAVTRPSLGDPTEALAQSGATTGVAPRLDLDPLATLREAHELAQRQLRRLLVLSTVTAFAVGLAVGVLLLRGWVR